MAYPAFAGAVDAGSYTLRIRNATTLAVVDVSVVIPTLCYWMPNSSSGSSIWTVLVTALNAQAPWTGVWSVTFAAANSTGVTATLAHSVYSFTFQYTTTPGTPLPLTFFGWELINYNSSLGHTLATVQPPKYTWFPKAMLNDKGFQPEPLQIGSSEVTGDGSQYSVTQWDNTMRYWRRVMVDGVIGALGARVSYRRQSDTFTDWHTPAGVSTSTPYVALDATDGWWRRTVSGQKTFMLIQDETNSASAAGPYVITYQSPGMPITMDGWKGLQSPNYLDNGFSSGYRAIDICFREST